MSRNSKSYHTSKGSVVAALLAIHLCSFWLSAAAQPASVELKPNPAAESWVRTRMIKGNPADLSKEYEKEEDRVLSNSFLEQLLTGTLGNAKVHWRGIDITGAIIVGPVNLKDAKIPYAVALQNCRFEDSVTFENARIGGDFHFDGSHFKKEADFQDIAVEGDAFFLDAIFEGQTKFIGAYTAKNFEALRARFNDTKEGVSFELMRVGTYAFFNEAIFQGPVDFIGMNVNNDFQAVAAKFNDKQYATNFENVKADMFNFNRTVFAARPQFSGMTYRIIYAGSDENLLALAEYSKYSADVYARLETFFRSAGDAEMANEVYIAQQRRIREEQLSWFSRVKSFLWDWVVGYGRKPWKALFYSCGFILLGMLVFRRKKMETQQPEYHGRKYNAFWYSSDLFLPIINLQNENVWIPRKECRWAWHYMHVHIIAGWILITIALAALTGIVK